MSERVEKTNDDQWPGWGVYRGRTADTPADYGPAALPTAPPWRRFPRDQPVEAAAAATTPTDRGATYRADRATIEMVNAALYLRRPLLVTGKPGSGKSTLPYAVARELRFGEVLRWNITSRTTLRDGLYRYDALARLHDYNMSRNRPVADYIDLGPLGTALLPSTSGAPRVLLIDEIDKADIDLPNDLLNVFEEGYFDITELTRDQSGDPAMAAEAHRMVKVRSAEGKLVEVPAGRIHCTEFPFVVLTSNGEREFPPPFLRRCLRLYLPTPDENLLARIIDAHLPLDASDPRSVGWRLERERMIKDFVRRGLRGDVATDQLLNALFMTVGRHAALDAGEQDKGRQRLLNALLRHLTQVGAVDPATGEPAEAAAESSATRAD